MILSEIQQQEVNAVLLAKIEDLEGVYLFGSGATSDFTSSSDIDLAFKAKSPVDQLVLWDLKNELSNLLGREVDLIDLEPADTVMRMQVVSTGVRIYCQNHTKSEAWDSLVYSMYLKLNEDRKEVIDEIAKSGKIYG